VDNTAPGAVADLAAGWTGSDVQLTWTAPGDDGASGRSLRYDIRYSTAVIDGTNWEFATLVTRESYPAVAGTPETFTVPESVSPDTTYYFAMKSKDEEGNWSALSNTDAVFTGGGECDIDDDCDDGLYCTGQETCDAGHNCQPGTPIVCSHLDDGCNAVGACDEGLDQCIAITATDGMSCDDGNPCTDIDQCWSGLCQTVSPLPVQFPFNGGDGGILETGLTHIIPTSNGGGLLETNLDLDTGNSVLALTTTVGDLGRKSDSTQNDQHNPLSVRVAADSAPLRISTRLVPDAVHGWDILDDYQSAGALFGIGEDDYVKLTLFHKYGAFGGTENDDPTGVGFHVGVEQTGGGGAITENNVTFPGDITTVSTMDLHLEVDPAGENATACYQVDGGAVISLLTGSSLNAGLFTECSYASIIHTSNDYFTAAGDAWHPNYDDFSVTILDHDSDGYTVCAGGDRDDHDDSVYPGAVEICDGLDNDQDGTVDNGGDALCDDVDPCTLDTCAGTSGCQYTPICDHDISGIITYYRTSGGQEPGTIAVADVTLDASGPTTSETTTSAPSTGEYSLLGLAAENISVTPSRTGGINGISSLDASRISQYRVGLYSLTANQFMAADVSGNGGVSSYDASLVSQYRVGLISRFPAAVTDGSDWTFAPGSREYEPLDADQAGQDYLGILYGDVTGNWTPPGKGTAASEEDVAEPWLNGKATATGLAPPRSGVCTLSLRQVRTGAPKRGQARLALHAAGCAGLLGLDATLAYDSSRISISEANRTEMTAQFSLLANERSGRFELSVFGPNAMTGDGELLILDVNTRGRAVSLSQVTLLHAEVNEGQIPTRIIPGRGPGREVQR